jgi:hypothetical protein
LQPAAAAAARSSSSSKQQAAAAAMHFLKAYLQRFMCGALLSRFL